ncbi:hypothetical protein Tco_0637880, partial [Tanacetum coccineum]
VSRLCRYYTSVHSKARSWSIPSEDPYEEAGRQLLEQAPRLSSVYTSIHGAGGSMYQCTIPETHYGGAGPLESITVLRHYRDKSREFGVSLRHHDAQKDRAAVRAEIEALARSEAHCRALEARVTVLETEVRRHEWQRQAADDLAVQHIMRTQALEAGARIDTLKGTGSSS